MALSLSKLFSGIGQATKDDSVTTVGIDIGGSSVKVVEIEETPRTIMLRTYGELQLGPYDTKSIGEIVSLNLEKKVEAVTDVMREAAVSGRHGALAMPLSSSFLTVIPVTVSGKEDLASRIPVEARKYVPLPLPDVTLDWTELPQLSNTKSNTHEVMIAAIENNALGEYRSLLSSIGMVGEPAEIEAFSLIRALWKQADTTAAFIDLGARSSKLYIVRDGNLERLHRVPIGGKEITRALSVATGTSFEVAEEMKRSYLRDQDKGADIYKTMVDILNGPLSEFQRLLANYESRIGGTIGRVAFTGGVATSPYFLNYAQDKFGRPIEIADPFAKVAYPAFMEDTLHAIGPIFGTALGAALRKFQTEG